MHVQTFARTSLTDVERRTVTALGDALAARGALSQLDLFARSHDGTWHLFREHFAESGRVDRALTAAPQQLQKQRIDTDFKAILPSPEAIDEAAKTADSFCAAVADALA